MWRESYFDGVHVEDVDASDLGFAEYFEDLAADSSHSHDEDA